MMKKITILCLSMICALSLAACGSNSSTSVSSDNNTHSMDQSSTSEETPSAALTAQDAYQLVSEKAADLSISANDTLTLNGRSYYLFLIQDSVTGLTCQYAVDSESGQISVYDEDGQTLNNLSASPFYSAELDAECDWNGTFTKDSFSIELMQGDPQSFEFTLSQDGQTDGSLFGVAYIHGNLARFHDEEADITLDFVMDENARTITLSGDETYAGVYHLS